MKIDWSKKCLLTSASQISWRKKTKRPPPYIHRRPDVPGVAAVVLSRVFHSSQLREALGDRPTDGRDSKSILLSKAVCGGGSDGLKSVQQQPVLCLCDIEEALVISRKFFNFQIGGALLAPFLWTLLCCIFGYVIPENFQWKFKKFWI